jgi:hypothetical protein
VAKRTIQTEVSQDSLSGPVLFNIYIGEVPSLGNCNNVVVSVYADVTEVTVQSGRTRLAPRKLNNSTKMLKPCLIKWRTNININKCSTTLLSKRQNYFHHHLFPLKTLQALAQRIGRNFVGLIGLEIFLQLIQQATVRS